MKIAVLFKPATGVGSSNEALNIVHHNPDVFIPVSSSSIGGKPGVAEVDMLFGKHIYYPVASLMDGLKKVDPDGILICTIGQEVYASLPEMVERWPVAWRFNINPLEFTFDPGMVGHLSNAFNTLGQVDAIVSCSQFVEENLKQMGCENVTVIPTCLDTEECVLADPKKDLVVSLTRISPVKNMVSSILAMGRVVNDMPATEYEIYGMGVLSAHITDLINRMGTERISYKGFEPAHKVLPRAKLFLQTSISENFSLSVLEAMAFGIPVVTSDIPGHAMGTVYFDSIKQIADKVKQLLTDDALWNKRRKEGLGMVKEFDVHKIVPQYESLFKKLMRLKDFKGMSR